MYDIGGVHEQQPSQYLIHEVLNMLIAELLPRVNNPMKVCFHEVSNDVDVGVAGPRLWPQDIHQSDEVIMFEELWIADKVLSILISLSILLASIRS